MAKSQPLAGKQITMSVSDSSRNPGMREASVILSPNCGNLDLYRKSTQQESGTGFGFQGQAVVLISPAKIRANPYLCQQLLHPKKCQVSLSML